MCFQHLIWSIYRSCIYSVIASDINSIDNKIKNKYFIRLLSVSFSRFKSVPRRKQFKVSDKINVLQRINIDLKLNGQENMMTAPVRIRVYESTENEHFGTCRHRDKWRMHWPKRLRNYFYFVLFRERGELFFLFSALLMVYICCRCDPITGWLL